ncbi:hypothetical protein BD560DRAFT_425917 [Blakeslea trispora]|nr:hypothetical protein BD560DRAFT_425917 [Blakeslea trispora]
MKKTRSEIYADLLRVITSIKHFCVVELFLIASRFWQKVYNPVTSRKVLFDAILTALLTWAHMKGYRYFVIVSFVLLKRNCNVHFNLDNENISRFIQKAIFDRMAKVSSLANSSSSLFSEIIRTLAELI